MNDDLEGSGYELIKVLIWHLCGGTEKTMKNRIAGVPAEM
jgi:hypothetical protein